VPGFGGVMRQMGFPFALPRRRALEEAFRAADVVHVQFPFPLGVRAASIARRMGKPLVAGFHVQPENMLRNVGLGPGPLADRLSAATYRLFLRTLYRRADAVVCPSEFAAAELQRHGLALPADVVSNGIAPEFRPGEAERPERHRERFLALAVGRLAREKRLDVIVEGVRRSRHAGNIQLVITGRGPEARRIARLSATLPLPAEVTFAADGELRRLLASADVLIHASEVELEGMAVLEAMGCGTPALIADAPRSATPALAASPALLFRPGDPADLARRLDALVEDRAALEAARGRCLEMARELDLARSVRRLEEVYRRVAGQAAVSAAGAPAGPATASPAGR
jgi:glycosyltransferase involved in cell wall biosynthesis